MFDPDTPATGVGGNGTNSFLHWFQDGLTSDTTNIQIGGPQGKTVFPLVNALHIAAVQSYVYVHRILRERSRDSKVVANHFVYDYSQPGPPVGQTHRYTQMLIATTGLKPFNVSRQSFDMAAFVKANNLSIVSSNFFNVTGV